MNQYYPHLFEPFTIKKTTFRNHIFSAPNMMCHMDANGFPTDYMIAYYAEKAKGGAAQHKAANALAWTKSSGI